MGLLECGHSKIERTSPEFFSVAPSSPHDSLQRYSIHTNSPEAFDGEAFSGAESPRPCLEDSLESVCPSIKELVGRGEMGNTD